MVADWWRHPALAYGQGLREGYANGYDDARRALAGDIAAAAGPLPHDAAEVVRRLVRSLEMGRSAPRTGAGAKISPTRVRSGDWPGYEQMSGPERRSAYSRLIRSWEES